ncbi:hypothetical protein C0991_002690 [Blastosporella zonata]|nr:hypothetical protein C0991_002690 [Blastosporella zonata]
MVKPLPTQPCTFYDILGASPSASVEEVRKAYRRKALETHPDKLDQTATKDDRRRAEKKFRDIREAFDILGDAQKRKEYDVHLRSMNIPDPSYSEYLKNSLKDREQWARKRREEASRSESPQTQHQTVNRTQKELKEVPREVQEIVDAINVAIDEARPGWLERLRRVQELASSIQIKASFEAKQAERRV